MSIFFLPPFGFPQLPPHTLRGGARSHPCSSPVRATVHSVVNHTAVKSRKKTKHRRLFFFFFFRCYYRSGPTSHTASSLFFFFFLLFVFMAKNIIMVTLCRSSLISGRQKERDGLTGKRTIKAHIPRKARHVNAKRRGHKKLHRGMMSAR